MVTSTRSECHSLFETKAFKDFHKVFEAEMKRFQIDNQTSYTVENRRFDQCVLDWTNQCKSRLP